MYCITYILIVNTVYTCLQEVILSYMKPTFDRSLLYCGNILFCFIAFFLFLAINIAELYKMRDCLSVYLTVLCMNALLGEDDIICISFQMAGIKEHPSEESITTTLETLSEITSKSDETEGGIFSGEIQRVTDILDTIADVSQNSNVAVDETQAKVMILYQ